MRDICIFGTEQRRYICAKVLGMEDTIDISRLAKARNLVRSGAAKSIREGADLSLTEMADAVGVNVATVWRWEQHQMMPRADAALRYLRVLEVLMAPE